MNWIPILNYRTRFWTEKRYKIWFLPHFLSYVWHKIWTEDIISGRLQGTSSEERWDDCVMHGHGTHHSQSSLSFSFSFSYNTLPALRFPFKIAPKLNNNGDIIIKCWQSLIPTLKPYHLYIYIIQGKSTLKMRDTR